MEAGDRNRRATWRSGRSAPRTARTGDERLGRWQRREPSAAPTAYRRGRWWLFVQRFGLTAASLGLALLLVRMFLDLKPSVPLVMAVIPGYDRPLGPLFSGEVDRLELAALGGGRAGLGRGTVRPIDLSAALGEVDRDQFRDAVVTQVGQLKGGGPGSRTAIVYLAAGGGVDRDGRACLVPPRLPVMEVAAADRAWLRVTDLLQSLAKLERRPAHLVLVLDACRSARGESLGILDGGFAAAVEVDVRNAGLPGIHVIVPAGPGQKACAAAGSISVFTAAFIDGVEGCGDIDRDGRVTLRELGDYLTAEVGRRAILEYGRSQTPLIASPVAAGSGEIGVSWQVRREPLARTRPAGSGSEDRWLADRWEAAAQRRAAAIATRPEAWATLERLLMRAERLAGVGSRAEADLRGDVETIEEQLAEPVIRGANLPGLRLASLAGVEPADLEPSWRRAIETWPTAGSDAAAKLPPAARDRAEWRARTVAAWTEAVARVAAGADIDRAAWAGWIELIGPCPSGVGAAPPWPLEIQAARLLVQHGEQEAWQRDRGTFGRVITLLENAMAATLPADVRADPVVATTPLRGEADRRRRQAYDLAFVGDGVSLATAARLRNEAAEAYATIAANGQERSGHWHLLDHIRAELPWLAIWLKERAGVAAERTASGIDEIDWPELLEATRDLERALTAGSADEEKGAAAALEVAATRARRQFIPLRKAYDDACERLADRSAENVTTLAEIRGVLAVPLAVGARRLLLRERERELAEITAGQRKRGGGGRSATDWQAPAEAAAVGWVGWQRGRFIDPFVAAIVPDAPGVPDPKSAADLADAHAAWGQLLRESGERERERPENDTPASAAACSRRLAVMADGRQPSDQPATEQIRLHWRQRLGTVAEGAVEEFLARADRDEREWFLVAAEACLAEAHRLGPAGQTNRRLESVAARLQDLERAGDRWAELVNSPDKIGGGDGRGSSPVSTTLAVATAVPPGAATLWLSPGSRDEALWLRSADDDGDPVRGVPLPVARPDATGRPRAVRWRVDGRSAGQLRPAGRSTLDATAWFRGHRLEASVRLVTDGGGIPVVWKQRELKPPRITVAGRDRRKGYVTFIFDCSGSMGSDRMARAKKALQTILDSLAQTRSWEASVWLYGHRTGWTQEKPYEIEPSGLGRRQKRGSLPHPAEDVEQVQPLAPVTPAMTQGMRSVLDLVTGWGETPLYLAVAEAIARDQGGVPAGSVWRIIILTDGVNSTAAYEPHAPPRMRSAQDVRDAVETVNKTRGSPLAIDVIALDLAKPRDTEKRVEYENLQQIVRGVQGQWRDASNLEKLEQAFRDLLGLERWEVADGSGQPVGQAELGGSLAASLTPGTYTVRLAGRPATETKLELAGGEIIELFSAGPDRPLEHRRYDGGTEQGIRDSQSGLEDPGDPNSRWFVAAHLPRREGGGRVRFPVSLQADDERLFSPRPVELWAEVRPQGVADARPFVFVDPDLEPARPVPVIDLEIAWPEEAEEADMLVWFSPRRIDPAAVILLESLEFDEQREFRFPEELPGVTFGVRAEKLDDARSRLTVIETHAGGRDLPRLRLRVEPACERAEHLVDETAGTVTHGFEILLEKGKLPENTLLSIVDRDALKQHCVKPAAEGGRRSPLRVRLPKPD